MTGAELKTIRKHYGITRAWLSRQARVRERTVSYWEDSTHTVPEDVEGLMEDLGKMRQEMIDHAFEVINQHPEIEHITLYRFQDDEQLWERHKDLESLELGVDFHGSVLVELKRILEQMGKTVTIDYEPDLPTDVIASS